MRILITGAAGFIGRNLVTRLREMGQTNLCAITRQTPTQEVAPDLERADFVFHLAGVNRPKSDADFTAGNVGLTESLCSTLTRHGRHVPLVYTSSIQAVMDNPYGRSKRQAEDLVLEYGRDRGTRVYVARLPNVFGKWCKPHYNSAVATFCHQLARGLPITVNDPNACLRLVYIDDVVDCLVALLNSSAPPGYVEAAPVYETTVGAVVDVLRSFESTRDSLMTARVGTGLTRALYSTYVSYLPPERFSYTLPRYVDPRGVFVEMLKTPDCGQFSYFTAKPGITRGDHYHHTKTEKFLVIQGIARYQFRHLITGEVHEFTLSSEDGRVVESIPGWAHNIKNVGNDELIVMLWASEVFDRSRPDTVPAKVIA